MATTQLLLLSVGIFIVLFIIIYAISKKIKNRHHAFETIDESNEDEENFPNIQEEAEEISSEEIEVETLEIEKKTIQAENPKKTTTDNSSFMMISVHAKPNTVFSDYSFLQTLGSAGLAYGEHKIFHYDVKTDQGLQRLFSVAQLNKPGTFDIAHIETLHCKGLLLFIDLRACRKQTLALDCMLEAAYQLADDLEGIMYEGYNTPWHEDTPRALAQQLETYQKNTANILDEITY